MYKWFWQSQIEYTPNNKAIMQANLEALKGRHISAWGIALCSLD